MKKKFAIILALFLIATVCSAGCIDPETPVDPVDPVDPVVPVDPVTPVDPVDPVVPVGEYSVMFMLNYGDAGAYTAETVKAGETVSKPATPTRSGYTFNGWFTATESGAEYDFTQAVNADVTLYAQWTKKSSSSSSGSSSSGSSTSSTPVESPDVVASIGDITYTSLLDAITAAEDGDTVNVRAKTIDEVLAPWGEDSRHTIEKNITILGVNHDKVPSTWTGTETVLTGGLYLGYDDAQTRGHTITIKGITFQGKGLTVADQLNVVIENNKFSNVDGRAIAVLDQNKNGAEGSATIKNNYIDTASSVGIEVRNPHNVTVTGNNIANTQANGIQFTGGVTGVAVINENKLKDWTGSATEGRAIRVTLKDTGSVSVNENVLIYTGTARESYIKITGNGVSADVSGNYWNGVIPTESHTLSPYYEEDRAVEPVTEIKSYYTDEALTQLVDLAVAKIGSQSYFTLTEAINSAENGATINVMPGIITEEVKPWCGDSTHGVEKSITILGSNADVNPVTDSWNEAEDTVLTGGLYLGYDDSQTRAHTITVKGITFMHKGLLVACQEDVTVENNRFIGITDYVATASTHGKDAISVLDQNDLNGNVVIKNNYIASTDSKGIYLRNPGNVTIEGNSISNVKDTSINFGWGDTVPAFDNVVSITNNIMNTWGTADNDADSQKDGRAVRIHFNESGDVRVTFTGNTMINANAPEEFVKITKTDNVEIGGDNNWNNVDDINPIYDTVPGTSYKYLHVDGGLSLGGTISVDSQEELVATVNIPGTTVNLPAGTYTFPGSSFAEGVTLVCDEGTVFDGTSSLNIKGATVVGATFGTDYTGTEAEGGKAVSGTVYGIFKDCTFKGKNTLRYCYSDAGKDILFENCVINTSWRGIHFDSTNGNITFKNCEINGFNAIGGGTGTMKFEGCTFGTDKSSRNGLNIYLNTTLIDCTFNYISGKLNFIDMEGEGKTLTITNCVATLDGVSADIKTFIGGSKILQNTVIVNGVEYTKP